MATVQVSGGRPLGISRIGLLILAVGIGLLGLVLAAVNKTGAAPAHLTLIMALFVGSAVFAEVVVRLTAPYADPVILPIAVTLTGLGIAMIYRLDLSFERMELATTGPRQGIFAMLGVILMAAVLIVVRNHRSLAKYTYTFMVISFVLLLLPVIPGIGVENFGSKVWANLFGFTFQPAEFVKVTLAIFFAGYLVTNRDKLSVGGPKFLGMRMPRLRDLGPILVVWLLGVAILVLQKDLGTSLLFFGLFVAMLYVATNRVSWLVIGALLFIPAALLAIKAFPHVQNRFTVWLNALDPAVYEATGGSYQVVQGLFGMATGGLLGTGWGRGYPQLVPLAQSDFILSSLAEELGLVGLAAILLLYLLLVERGIRAALGARDGFGKLLAVGLSFSFAIQVFVVLGGITRLIPLTGLTAPFLAQGGSSLLSSWIMVGLLLRISDSARRPGPKPTPWFVGDAKRDEPGPITAPIPQVKP
ncbi:FtsW/RodA/SpoVE family cell cycle protein [Actinomyces minihominis]|uniref:FtsW/RodA/SpoVE family cell cycle protein n=1 Tax=Actinomyces minihominis TaxID=2002838 RepID=UPI000C06FFB7|nr:FtsW/RodA/SpoVE family cell cycle protein [Actinomyces minihominis]